MEANVIPPPAQPKGKVWRLFAYFLGLYLLGQLTSLIFNWLQAVGALEGFAKMSQVIARSLDVAHNRDDAMVTVWSLLLAALLVMPLGWVYTYTKAKEGYDKSLVQTIIMMAMIVAGMM